MGYCGFFRFMMQVISFSGVYRLNFMECFMQMYYFYLIFCILGDFMVPNYFYAVVIIHYSLFLSIDLKI